MSAKLHVARTVGVMIALPMVFLALYLPAFVVLPESLAIRADLPRDLSIILLVEAIVVPLWSLGLYLKGRWRESKGAPAVREKMSTRDVY